MKIEDLNGCQIEVTDLDKAISITAEYTKDRHKDKSFSKADKRLKAYWKDMHKKLLKLKRERYGQSCQFD